MSSRCRQTDALLEATFGEAGLTRAQAAHAADCSECARALALARRFDGELHRVGVDLTAEMVTSAGVTADLGGSRMARNRNILGLAAVAVLVVAVVVGGGQWLSSTFGGRWDAGGWFGVSSTPDADEEAARRREAEERAAAQVERRRQEARAARALDDAALQAWLAPALDRTFGTVSIDDVEVVLADVCDDLFAVTFTDADDPTTFKWIAGMGGPAQGGSADSNDGSAIAAARGTVDGVCTRMVDAASRGPIMRAVIATAGVPEDVTPLGSTLLTPELAVSAVESAARPFAEKQRWIGLVRRESEGWIADREHWVGINIPDNDGLSAYELEMLDPDLEGHFIVGAVPPQAHTVELIVADTVYRYVVDAEPGVVILAPDEFAGNAEFRIMSSDPSVVLGGSIRR
jgi:hypothetical protein